jgi:pyruvate,water dikinase
MAVIVQRMVDSEKSGVAFSIDSVKGLDKEIIIEAVDGLGEKLVSGHVTPDYYSYNWYEEKLTSYDGGVLSKEDVRKLAAVIVDIQVYYGFPVDVEWAIAGGKIYILQSRPITTISYKSIPIEWTTADFRDGGVSGAACKALMGSLYGLVFNASFLESLKTIKMLSKKYNESIYETFFARPYWSLTIEKECFAKLPGFVEREIDEDMGVVPTYEGDGVVTKTGIKSLWSGIRTLNAISKHVKNMESKADISMSDLLARFEELENTGLDDKTPDEIHKLWVSFVNNDYYLSETTYFSYIFCNMILSTLFKDKIKKHIPANEIMDLMIGLSDLSHMRPIYEMWDMSRHKYSDEKFRGFIAKYKHHSQHELDISYPNWDEKPDVARAIIDSFSKLDDSRNPKETGEKQRRKFLDTLSKIPDKLHKDVYRLRRFLWLREEFRDVSTKSYYLIRRLTLALGRAWANSGVIEAADDIFFLTVADIEGRTRLNRVPSATHCAAPEFRSQESEFRIKTSDAAQQLGFCLCCEDICGLKETVNKNKKYYSSFVNFKNPNEVGNRHVAVYRQPDGAMILKGVPCSGGTITATARVIKNIHDADRLEQGDILVTKCTDPAWTAVFSKLSGVITETGGMLSHAAVVSREYGISCILVVKNATDIIKDGDIITMDSKTGEIFKETR